MAIATGTAIAIGAGVAAAGGAAQAISGAARARRAKKAIDSFQRQDLNNAFSDMRVSTLGAELQTEEAQRRFATSVDALASGGVRGLVGGLGRQEQLQQQSQRAIAAGLDMQQTQIDRLRAQDEVRLRQMQESREEQQLGALYGELAAGRQGVQAGLGSIVQAGGSFAAAGMKPTEIGGPRAKDLTALASTAPAANLIQQGQNPINLSSVSSSFVPFSMDATPGLSGTQITSGLQDALRRRNL